MGEIAAQLVLSPNTVSTYRARVLEKAGVRNDVELALYAVRAGLPHSPVLVFSFPAIATWLPKAIGW